MDDALFGIDEAHGRQLFHRSILGAGQYVGFAELHMIEGELRVEIDAEAAFGIQRAVLLVEVGIELGVNDLQSGTDAHSGAVGLHHLGVAGIYAHARADSGLRHVHRGDVAGLELVERAAQFAEMEKYDVVITSYSLIARDFAEYQEHEFRYEFLDAALYIKNSSTQTAKAVKSVNSRCRFALTGTPVENSFAELWSIFDYIVPDYLFSYRYFRQHYESPVVKDGNEQAKQSLQRIVKPFILRRMKSGVLTELPEKTETVLLSEMEKEQSGIYSANVAEVRSAVTASNGDNTEKIKILAMLTRLRQICCDPALVYDNYTGKSAKLEQCMELVESCVNSGHKLLLFSQFTSMLDIVAARLDGMGIRYFMLTGSTKPAQRLKMVNSFNSDNTSVFLISLKAGGTGLNLTGADVVIHYDPWWNSSAENQASDRAYRIGQKKNVQIYKLITRNTIEEKIRELQQAKSGLADIILSGGENSGNIMSMTSEEILELLK